MAAYHQMGHDTENLVGEIDLDNFRGIVLSPVNRTEVELTQDVVDFRNKGEFDIVLDPQLYVPNSDRGYLSEHPYFRSDLDTADLSSDTWWLGVVQDLVTCAETLGVNAVTSPVVLPNVWNSEYYLRCSDTARKLRDSLSPDIRALTSVVVDYGQMANSDVVLGIASVASEAPTDGYYLVVVSGVEPRRELNGEQELAGLMSLVRALEATDLPVVVSHCSSDMVLFKAAGATHCATGKFFNLRRFTRTRYEEPASGGGQLAYWFEHGLMGFLRRADLERIRDAGFGSMIGSAASSNFWSKKIQDQFVTDPGKAWVALGWRQYLSWFGKTEASLTPDAAFQLVRGWLMNAEQNWLTLEDNNILMDEPRNQGMWIRSWRQALSRFQSSTNQS